MGVRIAADVVGAPDPSQSIARCPESCPVLAEIVFGQIIANFAPCPVSKAFSKLI